MKRVIASTGLLLCVACRGGESPTPAEPTATAAPAEEPQPAEEPGPTSAPSSANPGAYLSILPKGAGEPTVSSIVNLERLPELTDTHRQLLEKNRFFVAPQSTAEPKADANDPAAARTSRRAKHLFQVYERNDYIRFPSFVTADLGIDLTHQYFEAVLRRIEREHLAPRLLAALQGFTGEALALHKGAKTSTGKKASLEVAVYWGTALRLLEQPATDDEPDKVQVRMPWFGAEGMEEETAEAKKKPVPTPRTLTKLPATVEARVSKNVAKIHAARAKHTFPGWGMELDLTQTKPRSHYAGSGIMQRYFRSMSFLGLSSFAVDGEDARPEVLAILVRTYGGVPAAAAKFEELLAVTNFVVGEPPTSGLSQAMVAAQAKLPKMRAVGADVLADPANLGRITSAWAKLPPHPIEDAGPVVQPIGQRVFADTLAMSALLGAVVEAKPKDEAFVKRSMGALGSAAVLGSARAEALVTAVAPKADVVTAAFEAGRAKLGDVAARDDAYHGTLRALQTFLGAKPLQFDSDAYATRTLQSFAGGWAMLRHDTLLYAYEMGAECDAEEYPPPAGWVEPVPATYAALREMVQGFQKRVDAAGIKEPASEDPDGYDTVFHTLQAKTDAMTGLLTQLEAWSKKELRGEPFTPEELTEIAMVGGYAEHVLLTLADAFELGEGNDDMAIVADVFTWRGRALEVGVAHPELIFAVIPTPQGWTVARGAVMGYREFLVPAADRMTDEKWRERVGTSKDFEFGTRPDWLAPISAPAVGVVELPPKLQPQQRCGYYGGYFEI